MVDRKRLNFQHLGYLQALIEERHVTRAAERVGIGQPAMSSALAKLRLAFRDLLLVKTTHGMQPTPKALELLMRVRAMSDLLQGKGLADDQFDPKTCSTEWRLMSSDGISRIVLPELMRVADGAAPAMRFMVTPGDPRRLGGYLRDGEFDLALAFVREPHPELRQVALYPQRLVCIARRDHPQVQNRMTLKQFIGQRHARWGAPPVAYATMEVLVDEVLAELGYERSVAILVSSLPLLPGIVAGSDLLAIVPEQLAKASRETLDLQILDLPFSVPGVDVSLLWHERMHQDPGHQWLRSTLRQIGSELAALALASTTAA